MTGEFAIAVHALVFLNHKGTTISSEELAKNVCTNPARVRKVMAKLKKANLVLTKEGVEGGYYFEKNPAQVNLRQIDEAVEVPIVSVSWRSGNIDMNCLIASGMGRIMDEVYAQLNQVCAEKLEKITLEDIDKEIFGNIH